MGRPLCSASNGARRAERSRRTGLRRSSNAARAVRSLSRFRSSTATAPERPCSASRAAKGVATPNLRQRFASTRSSRAAVPPAIGSSSTMRTASRQTCLAGCSATTTTLTPTRSRPAPCWHPVPSTWPRKRRSTMASAAGIRFACTTRAPTWSTRTPGPRTRRRRTAVVRTVAVNSQTSWGRARGRRTTAPRRSRRRSCGQAARTSRRWMRQKTTRAI
jgi:hypothetical protein